MQSRHQDLEEIKILIREQLQIFPCTSLISPAFPCTFLIRTAFPLPLPPEQSTRARPNTTTVFQNHSCQQSLDEGTAETTANEVPTGQIAQTPFHRVKCTVLTNREDAVAEHLQSHVLYCTQTKEQTSLAASSVLNPPFQQDAQTQTSVCTSHLPNQGFRFLPVK